MYYLIGGIARVGKTSLANMVLERKHIPFIPADVLTHSLDKMFQTNICNSKWEDVPVKFFPYLKEFVGSITWTLPNYLIEGDSFFPEQVNELKKEFPGIIKAVFLGSSRMTLKEIQDHAKYGDWTLRLSEDRQKTLPADLMARSAILKSEAEKYGIPYFDMADNREQKFEDALNVLFS